MLWLPSGDPMPGSSPEGRLWGQTSRVWLLAPLLGAMRMWSRYLTLFLHSLTWKPHTHLTGLKRDIWKVFNPSRSRKGDASSLSSSHPSQPHSVMGGSDRGTGMFPTHFLPRRDISVKHNSRHSFMICFPFPVSLKALNKKVFQV